MSALSRPVPGEGEAPGTGRTTCTWAACHNPAAKVVDGWAMCTPHVAEHYALQAPERPKAQRKPPPVLRSEVIRELHALGYTDRRIAAIVGCHATNVAGYRRRMGLAANKQPPRPIAHGSQGGYRAHLRRGDAPCAACRQAEAVRTAGVKQRRRAA